VPWNDAKAAVEKHLDRRATLLRTRREMMSAFVEAESCRWATLCGYLGACELLSCGHCDVCRGEGARRRRTAATRRVKHVEFGIGTVVAHDDATMTVLFDDSGYRTLSRELAEGDGLLVDV
jgi:ATP-dependent DNA helicase RecQ